MRFLSLLGSWGPVIAWMGAIYFASSGSVPGPVAAVPDWATHGAAYLMLVVLLCRALAGGFEALPVRAVVLSVALTTLYGVLDEYHQSFVPGRHAEVADVVKDLLGAVLGGGLYSWMLPPAASRRENGER